MTQKSRKQTIAQSSETRWQTIFENMKDTVMTVNRHYQIMSINHVQQGFTKEDVIGKEI